MNSKELQIGDWIYRKDGNDKYQWQVDLLAKHCNNVDWFEPVPLTEEILKINGFILLHEANNVHHKTYSMPTDYRHCLEDAEKKGGFYWQSNGALICLLRYVHELQHALRLCGSHELADNLKIKE